MDLTHSLNCTHNFKVSIVLYTQSPVWMPLTDWEPLEQFVKVWLLFNRSSSLFVHILFGTVGLCQYNEEKFVTQFAKSCEPI